MTDDRRGLTLGETALAHLIFGDAIDYAAVRLHHRRWFPFQPRETVMAPDGDIWIPAGSSAWCGDFSSASLSMQGLFIHEMTHVWQAQRGGRWYLPLARHPFCRYSYHLKPGKPFRRYGIEQQAEIVRHAWFARHGGGKAASELEAILPFRHA
ncbi:vgr related protein [Sphingomonas abietis]|uniref:Vgr related protein n=2 Tax=Sphingomonas abietis TaxID=3012344 RepID=A0ABY7NSZ5_9SPHN|nr:vgr related protein [Sphingomonas abietis]WBO24625.1 vgr related protein [Sphingomonas abietis]